MIERTFIIAFALVLTACGSDETQSTISPPPTSAHTVNYDCPGIGRVTAVFVSEGDNSVQIGLPQQKPMTLMQVPAASGARYADAANNELWSKGNEAMLTVSGKVTSCTQASGAQP